MCIFDLITKIIAPIPNIEGFGSYLFVGPHPDDIEIGAGGTAKKLVDAGKRVTYLIATDGRFGTQNPCVSPDELAEIRRREAIEAANALGVSDVRFLGFPDGGGYDTFKMTEEIAKVICELNPDVVLAPDYTVPSEQHIDHTNVGNATANAFVMCGAYHIAAAWGLKDAHPKCIAFYYTHKPNKYVRVKNYKKALLPALRKHSSQFPNKDEQNSLEMYLVFRSVRMGLRRLTPFAEGFRTLGAIHVHCCPEVNRLK